MATGDIEGVPAQLRLVFTNVLKNAEEIVSARIEGEGAAKAFSKVAVFKLTVQVSCFSAHPIRWGRSWPLSPVQTAVVVVMDWYVQPSIWPKYPAQNTFVNGRTRFFEESPIVLVFFTGFPSQRTLFQICGYSDNIPLGQRIYLHGFKSEWHHEGELDANRT